MDMKEKLQIICEAFRIPGIVVSCDQLKSGHINDTYKVECDDQGKIKPYLVQKINSYVFRYPVEMMDNIHSITEHIQNKRDRDPSFHYLKDMTEEERRRTRIHFHHTETGDNYLYYKEDEEREFWRLSNFVEDSVSFDTCDDPKVLEMTGKAFGRFMVELSDFDADTLFEVIPDFHNTKKRFKKFFADVQRDPYGRCKSMAYEIAAYSNAYEFGCTLCNMIDKKELPIRVTHNDTKTNNVLFDKDTLEPLVVIDLDTVMPGLAAYDFGDTMRFAGNTAAEDETNLSKVGLSLEKYRAFATGYINETKNVLTAREIDSLATGCLIMTLECGMRFLDDYITGDKYFHIDYADHNRDRARCQLKLYQDMVSKYEKMKEILDELK